MRTRSRATASVLWYKRVDICAYLGREMLDNTAVVALSHGRQTDTRTSMQTIEYPPLTC